MAHRYVKGTRRTSAPTRLIVAVAEYSGRVEWNADGDCHYRALRVWATDGKRKGTSWQGSDEPKPYHPDDFWEYVNNACTDRSRVYIVADNASDLCTSTMFWSRLDRGDYSLCVRDDSGGTGADGESGPRVVWQGRLITGSPPDIIHVRRGNGTILLVSLRNYTEAPWTRLNVSTQYRNHDAGQRIGAESDECYDSFDKCCIATKYVRNLVSGWVERDCGTWKDTVAQLSVSLWRQKFYTTKVCRHENETAIALERASAYGGRNEVWYFGDVGDRSSLPPAHDVPPRNSEYPSLPGAIHRCDVSAQYPSLLATMPFPTRLKGTTGPISVTKLEALLHCFGVIADVGVNVRQAEYPRKTNAGSVYEIGRFRTTLAGPEILRLVESGGIETVHATAYYELGYPLQAYARHLLQERSNCRVRGDYCGELLAKCLATAIGGKFSQRTRRREPSFGVVNPHSRWGPYRRVMSDCSVENYWTVAGVCYRDVEVASGGKLLAALYCYLTSYGRVQMARYRESLYPELPFAQCTDGIWVGDKALSTLQRQLLSADRTPGTLRLVSSHNFARWYTPNHYYVDGRWVLSGYRNGYIVESADTVVETRDINHIRSCPYKAPSELVRRSVRRDMAGLSAGVRIGPDGWMIPKHAKG